MRDVKLAVVSIGHHTLLLELKEEGEWTTYENEGLEEVVTEYI
jgi:hypothetical protein